LTVWPGLGGTAHEPARPPPRTAVGSGTCGPEARCLRPGAAGPLILIPRGQGPCAGAISGPTGERGGQCPSRSGSSATAVARTPGAATAARGRRESACSATGPAGPRRAAMSSMTASRLASSSRAATSQIRLKITSAGTAAYGSGSSGCGHAVAASRSTARIRFTASCRSAGPAMGKIRAGAADGWRVNLCRSMVFSSRCGGPACRTSSSWLPS
jgi:hypothetical protein